MTTDRVGYIDSNGIQIIDLFTGSILRYNLNFHIPCVKFETDRMIISDSTLTEWVFNMPAPTIISGPVELRMKSFYDDYTFDGRVLCKFDRKLVVLCYSKLYIIDSCTNETKLVHTNTMYIESAVWTPTGIAIHTTDRILYLLPHVNYENRIKICELYTWTYASLFLVPSFPHELEFVKSALINYIHKDVISIILTYLTVTPEMCNNVNHITT